jgi:ubiquinone/menaquinone biosynthesis C-methylase UbiE
MDNIDFSKKLIDEMNRYYEARAPLHDEYMGYESINSMETLLKSIIDQIDRIITGKSILELACGTGNWTQILAKRAKSVVAIDVSPSALKIADQKLVDFDNITLIECDAYDLNVINNSFDLIFAADWWSHIPKNMIHSFLKMVNGKLANGAKVVFIDMSLSKYFESETYFYDEDSNRVSLRKLTDGSEYRVVKNFPTKDELINVLTQYGRNVVYEEFASLKRWMAVFETA